MESARASGDHVTSCSPLEKIFLALTEEDVDPDERVEILICVAGKAERTLGIVFEGSREIREILARSIGVPE